jgi:hypothetical protein
LDHRRVVISLPCGIIGSLLAHLNTRWIEGRVLILRRRDQYHVFEMLQAWSLRQFVEGALFSVFSVGHGELDEALRLAPLLEEPHTCIEKLTRVVHVTQVRRRQGHVSEELIFEFGFKVGESRADNQATEWVPDKADLREAGDGAEGLNVLFDFGGKALAHFEYVSLG